MKQSSPEQSLPVDGAKASHTPGPWKCHYTNAEHEWRIETAKPIHPIAPQVGTHIALLQAFQPNIAANARLIAAAPDYYAAAEAIRSFVVASDACDFMSDRAGGVEIPHEMIRALLDAHNKAEGRTT